MRESEPDPPKEQGPTERVLALVRERGVLRPRDVAALGLSPTHLQRLYEQGRLQRSGRGIYLPADAEPDAHLSLAEVALRVPHGVVCLLSALEFHGLTTQLPRQVWLALPSRAHKPRIDWPPLRVVSMTGAALIEGVEEHVLSGVPVRIFSPAKTAVDCFKYRNKVGLDVALEALKDVRRKRRATLEEIRHLATLCHVSGVMRPYLEAVA